MTHVETIQNKNGGLKVYAQIGYIQCKVTVIESVNKMFTLTNNYLVHVIKRTDRFWYS